MKFFILPPLLFLFLYFTIAPGIATGQAYNNAVGIRAGTDWGITFKQRILKKVTIEAILQSSMSRNEVMFTVLGEKHMNLIFKNINFYWGGGLHKGWSDDISESTPVKDPFGFTFIGGAELSLFRLNFSYDIKPSLNLVGGSQNLYFQTGISARYILNKRKKYQWEKSKNGRKRQKKAKLNKHASWKFWRT